MIWGSNPADDFFVASHSVRIPDALCVLNAADARDNDEAAEATRKLIDEYLIDLATLEQLTGQGFPVAEYLKTEKLETSWVLPIGCDKG